MCFFSGVVGVAAAVQEPGRGSIHTTNVGVVGEWHQVVSATLRQVSAAPYTGDIRKRECQGGEKVSGRRQWGLGEEEEGEEKAEKCCVVRVWAG